MEQGNNDSVRKAEGDNQRAEGYVVQGHILEGNILEEQSLERQVEKFLNDLSQGLSIFPMSANDVRLIRSLGDTFRNGKHGVVFTDQECRILAWNPTQEQLTGLTCDQVVGKALWEVQYAFLPDQARRPELLEKLREKDLEFLSNECWPHGWNISENLICRPDGSSVRIQQTFFRLITSDGPILLCISHEAPPADSAEKLRMSEAKYRSLYDAVTAGIIVLDADGHFIEANQTALEILGIDPFPRPDFSHYGRPGSLIYEDGSSLPNGEHPGVFAARKGEPLQDVVVGLNRADGQQRWIIASAAPIVDHETGSHLGCMATLVDITERKCAEVEHARLAALVESSSDAIISGTLDGIITNWNDGAEKLYGYSASEMIGQPLTSIIAKERHPEIQGYLDAAARGEMVLARESKRLRKDGSEIHISYTVSPIKSRAGAIIGVSGIVRDITERIRSDEEHARLAAIVESSHDAIMCGTLDGIITAWNRGAEWLYEVPAEEMIGKPFISIVPEERQEWVYQHLLAASRKEHASFETARTRKDGTELFVSYTSSPVLDREGNVIAVSTIARDITARKNGERERARLAAIVESSNDAIISGDLEGVITGWNRGAEQLFGFSAAEMLGFPVSKIIPEDRAEEMIAPTKALCLGRAVPSFETKRLRKDRSVFDVSITVSPVRDDEGKVVGTAGITRDITERKRAEEALKESEARFRRLADNAPDLIYRIRVQPELSLEYVSPAVAQLTEYTNSDIEANPALFLSATHPDDLNSLKSRVAQNTIPAGPFLIRIFTKTGRLVWTEHRCVPIFDSNGRLLVIEGIARDVTEKMRAEQERESLLVQERTLAKVGGLLVSQLDIERVVQSAARECLEEIGVDVVELYFADQSRRQLRLVARGSCLESAFLDAPAQIPLSFDSSHVAARAALTGKIQLDSSDVAPQQGGMAEAPACPDAVGLEMVAYPLQSQHQLIGVLTFTCQRLNAFLRPGHSFGETLADLFAMAIDKAHLYQDLSARERQVELLLGRTIDAQEQERERICQEIRESVDHNLMEAAALLDSMTGNPLVPALIQTTLFQVSTFIKNGMAESRHVASSLRPESLDSLGLVATLSQELSDVAARSGAKIEFDADSVLLPKAVETAIYRMVKEAVYAIAKQADVTRMSVTMRNQETSLILTIENDGVSPEIEGFEPQSRALQLALISIRRRATLLGGFVSMGTALGKRSRLRITVPILSEYVQAALSSAIKSSSQFATGDTHVSKTSVLIVDDHVVARRGLRALLETDELVDVVGEAADGLEAVNAAGQLQPQVILMDMKMPRMDGLEATRQIKSRFPTSSVIILTSFEEEALLIKALQAGASGYLLKGATWELLRHTIRTVATGGVLTDANLLRKALNTAGTAQEDDTTRRQRERLAALLTEREHIVLKHLTEGKTNKEIADELSFSEITVKREVQSIIAKLEASDRTHAATVAIRLRLVE